MADLTGLVRVLAIEDVEGVVPVVTLSPGILMSEVLRHLPFFPLPSCAVGLSPMRIIVHFLVHILCMQILLFSYQLTYPFLLLEIFYLQPEFVTVLFADCKTAHSAFICSNQCRPTDLQEIKCHLLECLKLLSGLFTFEVFGQFTFMVTFYGNSYRVDLVSHI